MEEEEPFPAREELRFDCLAGIFDFSVSAGEQGGVNGCVSGYMIAVLLCFSLRPSLRPVSLVTAVAWDAVTVEVMSPDPDLEGGCGGLGVGL